MVPSQMFDKLLNTALINKSNTARKLLFFFTGLTMKYFESLFLILNSFLIFKSLMKTKELYKFFRNHAGLKIKLYIHLRYFASS